MKKNIAIIGGGPSGLFLYKRLIESGHTDYTVDIFEAKDQLGSGMPYSAAGANTEHITNVSGNEIPKLVTPFLEWLNEQPQEVLKRYHIDKSHFTDYKVFPRLLFGRYLRDQFELLKRKADRAYIATTVHLKTVVTDITDDPSQNKIKVVITGSLVMEFDQVIICTGHNWPVTYEGKVTGYFDSPYPPSKLKCQFNHEIAVRGASLTAIDGIRTLARQHGRFVENETGTPDFVIDEQAKNFRIVIHSRNGLLPAVRFHLDDPRLSNKSLLTKEQIDQHIKDNNGFLSLDFIFEKDFKYPFKEKDPAFYELIKDMSIEKFVETMMDMRDRTDAFKFFMFEYAEAKKSIRRKESVYWKEMLAVLSFAMNYPAKHLSAEDMQRLQRVLMPLISIVIAFVPQSSCEELIALYEAGRLELVSVGDDSHVEPQPGGGIVYRYTDDGGKELAKKYATFIDCIGQRHLSLEDFPFKSLVAEGSLGSAKLKFRSAEYGKKMYDQGDKKIEMGEENNFYLKVSGIAITDSFRAIDQKGAANPRLHVMAVPYISGYNPDYSGLDFCEEASRRIAEDIFHS